MKKPFLLLLFALITLSGCKTQEDYDKEANKIVTSQISKLMDQYEISEYEVDVDKYLIHINCNEFEGLSSADKHKLFDAIKNTKALHLDNDHYVYYDNFTLTTEDAIYYHYDFPNEGEYKGLYKNSLTDGVVLVSRD